MAGVVCARGAKVWARVTCAVRVSPSVAGVGLAVFAGGVSTWLQGPSKIISPRISKIKISEILSRNFSSSRNLSNQLNFKQNLNSTRDRL